MLQTAAILQVVVALAGASGGNQALTTIGDGLALMEARQRIEQTRTTAPAPAPRKVDLPTPKEIAADPSLLPPASAGSNGTHVPHASSLGRDEIFAHRRGGDSTAILLTGVALAPTDAPAAVRGAIDAANTIVGRPYVWGGGHASFYSNSYDCSGAVSFALFGGGLIPRPLTSGDLMHWGAPGPGKWITVYANPGHTFAEIAGLRFDTVGDEKGTGPRWHLSAASTAGFVARHPPGL
jgi:cell wall-associated NlpC family hydrolase